MISSPQKLAWWSSPLILALGRQKKDQKFKTILGYTVGSRSPEIYDPVSKTKTNSRHLLTISVFIITDTIWRGLYSLCNSNNPWKRIDHPHFSDINTESKSGNAVYPSQHQCLNLCLAGSSTHVCLLVGKSELVSVRAAPRVV